MITVYGNIISPYARKVYLTLEWKGLDFESVDVLPHDERPSFREISWLGKIPAFEDESVQLSDSSVICDYLEHRYPEPPLYPGDPVLRARALWLEEYADTRLQDVLLRGIVFERVIRPATRGESTNEARLAHMLEKLPAELDYLESRVPDADFLVGDALSIADLAISTCFINARAADIEVDPKHHPGLARYLRGIFELPLFVHREREEAAYLAQIR